MTSFPQDVYARNLLSYCGYPLWTPEPNIELPEVYQQEGLKIGDVGVVVPEEGCFDVFFNITLPREHPLHAADGVPNGFTQVKLRREDYRIVPDAESPDRVFSSSDVECVVNFTDSFYLDGAARRQTEHQFSLGQNEGAMLVLPQGAGRYRLAKRLLFLDVILKNAVHWYRFAREQLLRDISSDALYLITGFHKAQSWSLASFKDTGVSSAQCKIVQLRRGGPMLLDGSTWETIRPLEWRIGPRHSVGIPNQSVFIVGFKIALNEKLLGLKRVTVKAANSERTLATTPISFGATLGNLLSAMSLFQPIYSLTEAVSRDEGDDVDNSTPGHDSPEDEDEPVRVERIPQIPQPFHPSDIINRYLLKKAPHAKIVVTHDSQWIALLEKGILKQEDMLHEGRLEAAVSREYKLVFRNGAAYLQSIYEPTNMNAMTTLASSFQRIVSRTITPRGNQAPHPVAHAGPIGKARTSSHVPSFSVAHEQSSGPTGKNTQIPSAIHRQNNESRGKVQINFQGPLAHKQKNKPIGEELNSHMASVTHEQKTERVDMAWSHTDVPSGPILEIFFVGQTGVGKSTLTNMIMPGRSDVAPVSLDVRPCTTQTTPYKTVLMGGLRCRLWDTRGLVETSYVNYRNRKQMAGIAKLIHSQTSRKPNKPGEGGTTQNETEPAVAILMWCMDASHIRDGIHWQSFRRMYVDLCDRKVIPVIVATRVGPDAMGWEQECRKRLRLLDSWIGPDIVSLLGVRRHRGVSSPEYNEDCQALRDLIARLVPRQEDARALHQ